MQKQALEKQLFDCEGYDNADYGFQYYDCKLKTDIGDWKSGSKIDVIEVDFENSLLRFYTADDAVPFAEFFLLLSVSPEPVPAE